MTEAALQRKIQQAVKARGGKCYKLHGGRYGVAGAPDIIGVLNGVSFVCEVKRPGERATRLQEHELAQWRAQGWVACVVVSVEGALCAISPADEPGAGGERQ